MTKKKSKRNSIYGISQRSLKQLVCGRRNSVFARNTKIPITEWAVEEIFGALDEVDGEERIKVDKILISKIKNIMTRKKKVQEEQPVVLETPIVEMVAKKRSKVKVRTEVIEISEDEPEQTISDDLDFSLTEDDSPLAKDYTIDEILARIGRSGKSVDDDEPILDDILDKFDRDLESKGLGDDYFRKMDDELKEMKLEREIHEFEVDKMLNEED